MLVSRSENPGKRRVAPLAAAMAALALGASGALAHDISQSGEQKDMRRVGHVDLQGRPAYQPNVIVYPNRRTIAFVGTHGGSKPNPLKPGSPVEPNGTMIIDVTDPEKPVEKFHLPVPVAGGQSQMARMCLGSDLPHGVPGRVYLLRNIQGNAAQLSGLRGLGRDQRDRAYPGRRDARHPQHAQALVGVQDRHRVHAGQQRRARAR